MSLGGLRFIDEVNKAAEPRADLNIELPALPTAFQPALKKDELAARQFATRATPNVDELDEYSWGNTLKGPSPPESPTGMWSPSGGRTPAGARTPKSPNDLEMSIPATPSGPGATEIAHSIMNPYINRFRYMTSCLTCFLNGINDGAPGALLTYMEEYYSINYATVSMIFVSNAVGYLVAAPFVHALDSRLGRSKTLMLAEVMRLIGYIGIVITPSFGIVIASFFFSGLGMATGLALHNVFCVNLADSNTALAGYHGSYGTGATISPLVATALASHGTLWSRCYFLPMGLSIINLVAGGWNFRGYKPPHSTLLLNALQRTASMQSEPDTKTQVLKRAICNKTTVLGALCTFAYQGAEVAISGWVISYLITYRDGDPSRVGYVSSGFWAGITLGRFLLVHQAKRFGEKTFIVALTVGAFIFQLLVWLIPNVIGEAVACAILGVLLGPVAPLSSLVFSRLLPRSIQMSSLGFISAMGSSGGAVWPFLTGLLAQARGTFVLHPICLSLYVAMEVFMLCLPRIDKRTE